MSIPPLKTLSLLLVSGTVCLAASDVNRNEETPSSYQLDQVGVKAKRLNEKPESPYAVTESSELQTQVITREDIEALHPKTAWELLEQVPGFQVEEMGHKHQEWYYFRGSQSAMGVILDGVYLTQLDRVISTLPVNAIESVTIVRDATALTLGPLTNFSAMGSGYGGSGTGSGNQGFILIKTRRATKPEGEFSGSYGTYGAEKYGLSLGDRKGKFDYRLAGSYSNDPGKSGFNMEQRNTSIFFKAGYTGETLEAELLYSWEHGKQNGRNVLIVYPTSTYDYSKVGTMTTGGGGINFPRLDLETAALNLTQHWSSSQATTATFGYSGARIHMTFGGALQDQNSYSTSLGLRHVITAENNTFKTGVQRISYMAPNNVSGGSYYRDEETMNGLFVENEHRFFGGKLSVDGGLRVDQKVFDTGWESGSTASQTKARIAPAYTLGAALKATRRLTLTARVAHTENDPSKYQVTTDGSSLHTEKRNRLELGIMANLHPAFSPFATAFFYNTQHQKAGTTKSGAGYYLDSATGQEYDYVTESNARTHGLDLGASGRILAPLDYQVSWTVLGTDSDSANKTIAHHMGSAGLRYHQGPFGANLNARYVGPMDNSASVGSLTVSPYPLGDYTRIDANLNYDFKLQGKDAKVSVYGRNLTDKHYATKMDSSGASGAAAIDPGCTYGVQFSCNFF